MPKTYTVISDTSTRASADPASPDHERWLHWAAGETAASWPEHAPVDEWVASGHWAPTPAKAAKAGKEPA